MLDASSRPGWQAWEEREGKEERQNADGNFSSPPRHLISFGPNLSTPFFFIIFLLNPPSNNEANDFLIEERWNSVQFRREFPLSMIDEDTPLWVIRVICNNYYYDYYYNYLYFVAMNSSFLISAIKFFIQYHKNVSTLNWKKHKFP